MAVQLVPEPNSSGSLVLQYRAHLKAYDANLTVGPYTLEGYIGVRILLTAIEKNGPDITTESLVETLESMDKIDVGLGVPLGLSQEDHQACHAVWLRKLDTVCKFVDFTQITR
ncbi:MAG: ABC transporter substrate-binding protein [Proteobacteria bacterium]|nr:ABC transporter substrate-binding protein [Pseudomonadota bacterium]